MFSAPDYPQFKPPDEMRSSNRASVLRLAAADLTRYDVVTFSAAPRPAGGEAFYDTSAPGSDDEMMLGGEGGPASEATTASGITDASEGLKDGDTDDGCSAPSKRVRAEGASAESLVPDTAGSEHTPEAPLFATLYHTYSTEAAAVEASARLRSAPHSGDDGNAADAHSTAAPNKALHAALSVEHHPQGSGSSLSLLPDISPRSPSAAERMTVQSTVQAMCDTVAKRNVVPEGASAVPTLGRLEGTAAAPAGTERAATSPARSAERACNIAGMCASSESHVAQALDTVSVDGADPTHEAPINELARCESFAQQQDRGAQQPVQSCSDSAAERLATQVPDQLQHVVYS